MDFLKLFEEFGGYSVNHGYGKKFTDQDYQTYLELKTNPNIYWAVFDIDSQEFIAKSSNSVEPVEGASVPKVLAAACCLEVNNLQLPTTQELIRKFGTTIKLGKEVYPINKNAEDYLENLLIKSTNKPNWYIITALAGYGENVNNWAKKRGYPGMMPGSYYQGRWPGKRNQVSAQGMCLFWNDVLNNKFTGAKIIESITNACQTSGSRSKVFIPKDYRLGSKTGTLGNYCHDSGWIVGPKGRFSITVLTKTKSTSKVSLMWGGLFKEYISNYTESSGFNPKSGVIYIPTQGRGKITSGSADDFLKRGMKNYPWRGLPKGMRATFDNKLKVMVISPTDGLDFEDILEFIEMGSLDKMRTDTVIIVPWSRGYNIDVIKDDIERVKEMLGYRGKTYNVSKPVLQEINRKLGLIL